MSWQYDADGCVTATPPTRCDPTDLSCAPPACGDRFETAWNLLYAAQNALACNGADDCHDTWVSIGIPEVPPQCCLSLAVGILEPQIEITDGDTARTRTAQLCGPTIVNRYAITITRCGPDVSDGSFKWGDATGADEDTFSGVALRSMIEYHALLGGLSQAWCCQVAESTCCDCGSFMLREIREHSPDDGLCMGWDFIVSVG